MSSFVVNFTLQDLIGTVLAFFLFPLVIVLPGYICGWALNLFNFRHHRQIVRLGIGLILSFAVSPIIFDLTSQLSLKLSLVILGGFAIAFVIILFREKSTIAPLADRHFKSIVWMGSAWVIFVILSLINIQWKNQLYFSAVMDQITRVFVIEAMTRTGVPPINFGYYPGHPVRLTFLYYFWYIPCSLVDIIGGDLVHARDALNASSAWSGLGLMATAALYLRLRSVSDSAPPWRSAKIGISLFAVSGLDALPFIVLMSKLGNIVGDAASSNTVQFTVLTWRNLEYLYLSLLGQWVGSNLWVPHHVAAVIAGLTTIMLAQSARGESKSRQFAILAVAGFGFASAFGLSAWVTLVFVVFWGIWLLVLLLQRTEHSLILAMILAGIVAILLASPFLIGILKGGGTESTQLPVVFQLRSVSFLEPLVKNWSPLPRSLIMLVALVAGYLVELGFFFMAGIYWLKTRKKLADRSNPFYIAEILLLLIVLFISSCLHSTLGNNDLGWRSWLVGQFVLLVWGVDVLEELRHKKIHMPSPLKDSHIANVSNFLHILIIVGIMTTVVNAIFLRVNLPVLTGREVGKRSYSARLAYDFLRDHVSGNVIVQSNPQNFVDIPSGLFGTHQMVVSDLLAYGIPLQDFFKRVDDVGAVFAQEDISNWQPIDKRCRRFSIDILIVKDTDPLWHSLAVLKTKRASLYENSHYALFACGSFARAAR